MPITLGTNDYDGVRKLINVSLTSDKLPDSVIALPIYEAEAVAWVASRTTDETATAKRAVVYKIASMLLPAFPQLTSESMAGYSYQKFVAKTEERVAQLEALAESAISDILGAAYLDDALTHFSVAERIDETTTDV